MTLRVSTDEIVAADRSGLLNIHRTWERVRLGEVARVQNGFAFKSTQFSADLGMPLLRIRDVGSNRPETFIDCEVDPDYVVRNGDIVIGMDGDFRAAYWKGPDAALNQRVCRVTCTSLEFDQRFLFLSLQPYLDAVNRATSAITVKHLSSATVADLPVPFPPLAEQERIAEAIEEAFSKLDAGEAGLHKARHLLKRMRDSILTAAVTGRLTRERLASNRAEDGPNGWRPVTLGEIVHSLRNGVFVSRPSETPPGTPILRIGAVRTMKLDTSDVRYASVDPSDPAVSRAFLNPGDLLFTRYNGNPEYVGACAVVTGPPQQLLHPDKLIRVVVRPDLAVPEYVSIAASTGMSRRYLSGVTKTTAGQAGISGSDLKQMPLLLPPPDEQCRIVAEVERQFSFLDACERSIDAGLARSAALRRSILKAAFEGKLVPQDPNDEPASVVLERIRAERPSAAAPKRRARGTA